jgi:hypothetical protein
MEGMALLDPEIDSKHRAAKLCQHQKIEPLITRTPKENWRIHPDWVQRYVFHLILSRMYVNHCAETYYSF